MFLPGRPIKVRAVCRFLLRLFLRLLPVILGLSMSVELFTFLLLQAEGQSPYFLILMKLTGWVFSALLWLLFAWFSPLCSYLLCPGRRLNRLLSLAYLRRSWSSHG